MSEPRRRYAPNNEVHFEDEEALLSPGEIKKAGLRNGNRRIEKQDSASDSSVIILLVIVLGLGSVLLVAYWIM